MFLNKLINNFRRLVYGNLFNKSLVVPQCSIFYYRDGVKTTIHGEYYVIIAKTVSI